MQLSLRSEEHNTAMQLLAPPVQLLEMGQNIEDTTAISGLGQQSSCPTPLQLKGESSRHILLSITPLHKTMDPGDLWGVSHWSAGFASYLPGDGLLNLTR